MSVLNGNIVTLLNTHKESVLSTLDSQRHLENLLHVFFLLTAVNCIAYSRMRTLENDGSCFFTGRGGKKIKICENGKQTEKPISVPAA